MRRALNFDAVDIHDSDYSISNKSIPNAGNDWRKSPYKFDSKCLTTKNSKGNLSTPTKKLIFSSRSKFPLIIIYSVKKSL